MGRSPKHRSAILEAAISLFRERGYAATGIADILSESGAPKGSLYHYFPNGKEEVGAEAVLAAGRAVQKTLETLAQRHQSAATFLKAYCQLLGDWLEASDFQQGCPIATTLLETTPRSQTISAAGRVVLLGWVQQIAAVHERDGMPVKNAGRLATLSIAAIEGALILARVEQNRHPLDTVAEELGLRATR